MEEDERRAVIDGEHLRILSICYLVSAAITAFFSLFGLVYVYRRIPDVGRRSSGTIESNRTIV